MRQRILIGALIIMVLGAVWPPGARAHYDKDAYIRLHVIANSDSEADQAVKHQVRDAILTEYGDTFAAKGDIADAEHTISANLTAITSIAQATLRENGMPYGASSEYGIFSFPTRQYGEELLPAGDYHALRVILGEGSGANWWCVLFPPLCVHDTSAHDKSDKLDEEEKEEAEETKIEEETEDAEIEEEAEECEEADTSPAPQDEKETRPVIKFKFVEWIKKIFN